MYSSHFILKSRCNWKFHVSDSEHSNTHRNGLKAAVLKCGRKFVHHCYEDNRIFNNNSAQTGFKMDISFWIEASS